jgi:hypothetical protein
MGTTDFDLLKVLVASLAFGRCKFILILLFTDSKRLSLCPKHKSPGPKVLISGFQVSGVRKEKQKTETWTLKPEASCTGIAIALCPGLKDQVFDVE